MTRGAIQTIARTLRLPRHWRSHDGTCSRCRTCGRASKTARQKPQPQYHATRKMAGASTKLAAAASTYMKREAATGSQSSCTEASGVNSNIMNLGFITPAMRRRRLGQQQPSPHRKDNYAFPGCSGLALRGVTQNARAPRPLPSLSGSASMSALP
jgi:hypothetical protein